MFTRVNVFILAGQKIKFITNFQVLYLNNQKFRNAQELKKVLIEFRFTVTMNPSLNLCARNY